MANSNKPVTPFTLCYSMLHIRVDICRYEDRINIGPVKISFDIAKPNQVVVGIYLMYVSKIV